MVCSLSHIFRAIFELLSHPMRPIDISHLVAGHYELFDSGRKDERRLVNRHEFSAVVRCWTDGYYSTKMRFVSGLSDRYERAMMAFTGQGRTITRS